MITDFLVLLFLGVVEGGRLMTAQKYSKDDFSRELSAVFRVLVLTVPSMYAASYLTFFQTHTTR